MHFPTLDDRFLRLLPGDPDAHNVVRQVQGAVWSPVDPTPVAAPRLLAHAREVAAELGFSEADVALPVFARIFGGSTLVQGMRPYATNYGGHQFGHWAGQLGDGRAITLAAVRTPGGALRELQLKGAGMTPYSRHADGRAVLRSSIREFLCSEAVHHLGIPSTRALSLVATCEDVLRDMFYDGHPAHEPGAVVCRVAPSFLRFGHFQLPAARGDVDLLRSLVVYTLDTHFAEVEPNATFSQRVAAWFAEVCRRTALLVAGWMRVGFVHGVLNTDNMSILGLTIDYGPYGWIDDYDPDWTPNTTDAEGRRYRFGWQPRIAWWNLAQLAQALAPLVGDAAALQSGLDVYATTYADAERQDAAAKLGLRDADDDALALMRALQLLMHTHEIDMTLWFRGLADVDPSAPTLAPLASAFYDDDKRRAGEEALQAWLARHAARVRAEGQPPEWRVAQMQAVNPKFVLRNWLAQQAIDAAHAGDLSGVHTLLDVMREPYAEQTGRSEFAAKRPEWAKSRAGCSMLSCSS